MTDDDRRPPVDGPTAMSPTSGQLHGGHPGEPTAGQPDEPTAAEPPPPNEPTIVDSGEQPSPDGQPPPASPTSVDGPTTFDFRERGAPGGQPDEPTIPEPNPSASPTHTDGPTIFDLGQQAVPGDDEPTVAVVSDDPTTTGPTVGGWPFDQFEPPPPEELIWQPEAPPPPAAAHKPAYYVALGAAVVLVVGLVALATVVIVMRPREVVAGDASAQVPGITVSSQTPAPTTPAAPPSQAGPLAELAAHPLSSATTRMPDATCALPRFDPADDKQAAFYVAAKVCADAAWRPVLQANGLEAKVDVVTVTQTVQTQTCGEITTASPPTECDGSVYLTPAYLRDTEQNGRYPGRYLGVFLREYARAVQFRTGLDDIVGKVTTGSAADLDTRVDQQATCLAGVVSGAMAGRGAIDGNITNEIRTRLSTVDAPKDAQSWLDKGFQQRTPAACNAWT